jgi:hypothetical protein
MLQFQEPHCIDDQKTKARLPARQEVLVPPSLSKAFSRPAELSAWAKAGHDF